MLFNQWLQERLQFWKVVVYGPARYLLIRATFLERVLASTLALPWSPSGPRDHAQFDNVPVLRATFQSKQSIWMKLVCFDTQTVRSIHFTLPNEFKNVRSVCRLTDLKVSKQCGWRKLGFISKMLNWLLKFTHNKLVDPPPCYGRFYTESSD